MSEIADLVEKVDDVGFDGVHDPAVLAGWGDAAGLMGACQPADR